MMFMKKEEENYEFLRKQAKRIRIEGILCIALGILYLLMNILENDKWYMYLVTLALFVFGIYFVIKSYSIRDTLGIVNKKTK